MFVSMIAYLTMAHSCYVLSKRSERLSRCIGVRMTISDSKDSRVEKGNRIVEVCVLRYSSQQRVCDVSHNQSQYVTRRRHPLSSVHESIRTPYSAAWWRVVSTSSSLISLYQHLHSRVLQFTSLANPTNLPSKDPILPTISHLSKPP